MLFRLLAGAGRFVQVEGGARTLLRWRLVVSNLDAEVGVFGGTDGGRLAVPPVPLLDDRELRSPSSRSLALPRDGRSSSKASGLSFGLCLVFSAINASRVAGVTSSPGLLVSSIFSMSSSSVSMSSTPS